MTNKHLLLTVIIAAYSLAGIAQFHLGKVEDLSFFSNALQKETAVRVYLPPGYNPLNSAKEYPVIMTLHGASSGYEVYSFMFPIIDALWVSRSIDHFILVMPDGQAEPFNGSFYTNSSLYGNYEDLISEDIVPLIDSLYHTKGSRDFRAIMGHSMGAYGAFKQVLKHPALFTAVAGHSGPLHIEMLEMLIPNVKAENGDPPYQWRHEAGKGISNLIFTMAGAFSPNPASDNLVDFPLDEQGDIIDSVMQRWNPHNIVEMVRWHMPATDLSIYFDCGAQDEYHLYLHNRALSDSLNLYGIRHQYVEYNGDHTSRLPFRVPVGFKFIDQVFKGNLTRIKLLDIPPKQVVNVFPNPSNGLVYFDPENPEELKTILVTTSDGKRIRTFKPNQNPMNFTNLPQGTYQIFFQYQKTTTAFPIVITK
ncbi:MAG: alpha/beta hydrolase-fold protein [Bacteroidota bacterium]|nr:alpha/beta hydrolase-fold protein [Bacteroidota bacterium]